MLETYLINTNFVLLFGTCLFYWLSAYDFLPSQSKKIGNWTILLSQAFQATFLCVRWFTSHHFPLSNLYESLLFLSWILTVLLVIINQQQKTSEFLIGSIITPIILFINMFALFSLPIELKTSSALVPALQSNWLVMHVTVIILSYAALICGCLFSMAYLVLARFQTETNLVISNQTNPILEPLQNPSINVNSQNLKPVQSKVIDISSSKQSINIEQLMSLLDNLSYRTLGFGFPLLTIGLLSGSIWANQTWGSYWSWDPKETWALITWFVFAIYLHTRFSKGWNGYKSAVLATFGFFVLCFCYLGVNLMGKGLHSYGFLN